MDKNFNSISKTAVYSAYKRYANIIIKEALEELDKCNTDLINANDYLKLYRTLVANNESSVNFIFGITTKTLNDTTSKIKFNSKKYIISNNIRSVLDNINKVDDTIEQETVRYIISILSQYYDIQNNIKIIESNIKFLNNIIVRYNKLLKLDKKVFDFVINSINQYYEQLLIYGETVYLGYGLGTVKIINKVLKPSSKSNERIAWGETMKHKKYLETNGITTYSKEEHIESNNQGIKYDATKYFVYYTNDTHPYIVWIAPFNLNNRKNFTLFPSCHNYSGMKVSEVCNEEVENILDMNLGIRHKVVAICRKDKYHIENYRKIAAGFIPRFNNTL
jgi:hypothetical protein